LRVLWRKRLPEVITPFLFEARARSAGGLVFLASPTDGSIGQTTLVSIDLTGQIRSQVLSEIQSGVQQDASGASLFSGSLPGLTLDPVAGRAYVISGDGVAAEVDLATLAVSYHHLPVRTLASADKVLNGPSRRATWLGNGLIGVTGDDGHSSIDPRTDSDTPAGLTIIDTASWTVHAVDSTTSEFVPAGETLLAWDWTAQTSPSTGSGLNAYGLDGTPRFHLLGQSPITWVDVASGIAYVWSTITNRTQTISIIDLASRQVLRTITRKYPAALALQPLITP
jgi:hypothetical protein